MKLSLNWLKKWVPIEHDIDSLCSLLTMAGLEVDGVEPAGRELSKVIVGEVITCQQHPDADKLSLCTVSDGVSDPIDVVCGAPNVAAGQRVAWAQPGAVLPNGKKLKVAKLRGVESNGMLCSAAELELGEGADGIVELPSDAPLGVPLVDYLELDDQIIDIDLTPNRGDCLSVVGVAREIAALTQSTITPTSVPEVASVIDDRFPVNLEAPQGCAKYAGRIVKEVDVNRPTPIWMVEALRRAGVRSINPVVDITNYVMLEFGQPMHAFDLATLRGGIRVRYATSDESLELLDGQTVELDEKTLVIADQEKPIALAGIMGGEKTGVQLPTTEILFESAYFDPIHLAGVARQYKLHTDASHRFERGVDYLYQERAIERATQLLLDICGGRPGPIEVAIVPDAMPNRSPFGFRPAKVADVLGISVSDARIAEILTQLGCCVDSSSNPWQITAPSYRFDLEIEVDLVEEVARIHGYDNLDVSMPQTRMLLSDDSPSRQLQQLVRKYLIGQGFSEAITYSFIDQDKHRIATPTFDAYELENPISSDMSVMRSSLWPGLIDALQYNLNRQAAGVRLFEIGRVFEYQKGKLAQPLRAAAVALGDRLPEQWDAKPEALDYFDIKHIVTDLIAQTSLTNFDLTNSNEPVLHPGQSASLLKDGSTIGTFGLIHPEIAQKLDCSKHILLFQLDIDALAPASAPQFHPLSKFPAVRRDLSVVVGENTSAEEVMKTAENVAGELLRDLQLFDVFRGQGIDSDKKSLTLGLIFQAASRTLTEDEIETSVKRVLSRLGDDLGATLRK